jgi:hypothetical protein
MHLDIEYYIFGKDKTTYNLKHTKGSAYVDLTRTFRDTRMCLLQNGRSGEWLH